MLLQYTFGSVLDHGRVAVSHAQTVITRTADFGWIWNNWYGGLLEPEVDTSRKSYVEFAVEHPGHHRERDGQSCMMSMGVTMRREAPDGMSLGWWASNHSWMYYCNDSSIWPSPGIWETNV